MGEKKVAIMRLKVDLHCQKCYRKVKKVLCKFPQIQDQVYDEKQNTVTIKVVCCSPEKIMQKICCKGGDSIKSIEIVPPPKPKPPAPVPPPPAPAPAPPPAPAPKPPPAPAPAPAPAPPPAPAPKPKPKVTCVNPPPNPAPCFPPNPGATCCRECYEGRGGGPCFPPNPGATCCRECYEGRGGGPCYQLGYYGQPRCYDGYYGRPVYDSWGGGGGGGCCCRVNRCDCFCEENPNAACRIM